MTRPRLLDLFRGEGGAAEGYKRAGWDVTGVDIQPLGHRGPGEFILADALDYVTRFGRHYDAIHASPPCQGYSIATAGNPGARAKHDRLIAATRELLVATGRPWVILERLESELDGAQHEKHSLEQMRAYRAANPLLQQLEIIGDPQ
jgi:DNA (cytosine-5)-methyltransferase 1